jgi:hypothetical protein
MMQIQETLDGIKRRWLAIAKLGIFFSGIAAVLISPPPITNFNAYTFRFLITILIAFMLIPVFLYNKKKQFKYWLISSFATFIVAGILLVSYNFYSSKFVIDYYGTSIVIGSTILDSAKKKIEIINREEHKNYLDGSKEHSNVILHYNYGKAEDIWASTEIKNNKLLLVVLFYMSISFITILMVCLIQTLQILYSRKAY